MIMETQSSSSIEMLAVSDLKPYAKNARTHSKAQVEQIAASIREFGWTNPVLIKDDLTIIAGHGRVLAAKNMGQTAVPCIRLSHLTDEQVQAYVIADNKLATNAGWDEEILSAELQALADHGFQLDVIGFSDRELNALLTENKEGLTDPDEIPEIPSEPVSKLGDVWLLGKHRIICGDCTDKAAVDHLLAGVTPHLMVTDPPYGVNYDPSWRDGADLGVGKRSKGKVLNDDRADWTEAWNLFPGAVAYVWHGGLHSGTVETSLQAAGFACRAQIIWAKQHFVMSRGDYHWQHEPCWYAVRKNKTGGYVGDRKQTTIWEIANNNSFGNQKKEETFGHGTQKPVECMKRPILNNSSPGQAVYEPFSGSGTTIMASEITGRSCYAVELNPTYVDMAVLRWQKFTGEVAVNERTGLPFSQAEAAKD